MFLNFVGRNPYSIPMRSGWERIISQTACLSESVRTRKYVAYLAPCGKRLRKMNEVSLYLRSTDSKLTIDLFCFDPAVRPFVRYRVKNALYFDADFTRGNENVPIECVNCLSNEGPQKLNYEPRRYTTDRSVDLPFACEFLSGCDCEGWTSEISKLFCLEMLCV